VGESAGVAPCAFDLRARPVRQAFLPVTTAAAIRKCNSVLIPPMWSNSQNACRTVCAEIEGHRVQLLPTSPTFLNLLLVSEAYRRHDLSSLELVTYGTEVMPESR